MLTCLLLQLFVGRLCSIRREPHQLLRNAGLLAQDTAHFSLPISAVFGEGGRLRWGGKVAQRLSKELPLVRLALGCCKQALSSVGVPGLRCETIAVGRAQILRICLPALRAERLQGLLGFGSS